MASGPSGKSYSISFDGARQILVIEADGFWDRPTLDSFGDDLLREMHALRASGTSFVVLGDASRFPVQSMAISMGFMGIVKRIDRDLLVPTAIVAKGALLKLQALRVLVAPHIRIFGDHDSASAWLAEKRTDQPMDKQ